MSVSAPAVVTDFADRDGAIELKKRIEAYWLGRGFVVQVELVYGEFTQALRASRVDVRSDLLNGLPRTTIKKTVELEPGGCP